MTTTEIERRLSNKHQRLQFDALKAAKALQHFEGNDFFTIADADGYVLYYGPARLLKTESPNEA